MPVATTTFPPGWLTFIDSHLPSNAATLSPWQLPYVASPCSTDVPLLFIPSDLMTLPRSFAGDTSKILALLQFNATLLLARIRKSLIEHGEEEGGWLRVLERAVSLASIQDVFLLMPSNLLDVCTPTAQHEHMVGAWIVEQAKGSAGAAALQAVEAQLEQDDGSYHDSIRRYLNARTLKPDLPELDCLARAQRGAETAAIKTLKVRLVKAGAHSSLLLYLSGTATPMASYVDTLSQAQRNGGAEAVEAIVSRMGQAESHPSFLRYLEAPLCEPEGSSLETVQHQIQGAQHAEAVDYQTLQASHAQDVRRCLADISRVLAQHGALGQEYAESIVRGSWTEEEGWMVARAFKMFWEEKTMSEERMSTVIEARKEMMVFAKILKTMGL